MRLPACPELCFRLGFGINVVAVDRHIFFASEVVGEHQFQDFIVGRAQIFRFFGTLNQKEGYIQIQEGLAFGFAFNLGFARRVIFLFHRQLDGDAPA